MIAVLTLLCYGPCCATGPPPRPITEEQLHVLNRTLDALHEEVVAARAPSTVPLILFVLSVLLPLAAGVWLLVRAERSVIGMDETIRTLLRCGLAEPVIRQYLPQQTRPALPGPDPGTP